MEPTPEQLQAQVAELEKKLAESERGNKHLVAFFDERLREETEKRAVELLSQQRTEQRESVEAQFRKASVPQVKTLAEYQALPTAEKALVIEQNGSDFVAQLVRKQTRQDEEIKRRAVLEAQARANPRL